MTTLHCAHDAPSPAPPAKLWVLGRDQIPNTPNQALQISLGQVLFILVSLFTFDTFFRDKHDLEI